MAVSTWNIDASHSAIAFSVRHMVVSKTRGRFTKFTGQIRLDPDLPGASSVEVSIDPSSIDTADEQRDAHLRSADFFDVEKFPAASFRSTVVEDLGGDKYRIIGDLTVHGVTRSVVLHATYEGSGKDPWGGERAGFSANTQIKRSRFGLTWNQLLEAGGVTVGDDIKIAIDIELLRVKE